MSRWYFWAFSNKLICEFKSRVEIPQHFLVFSGQIYVFLWTPNENLGNGLLWSSKSYLCGAIPEKINYWLNTKKKCRRGQWGCPFQSFRGSTGVVSLKRGRGIFRIIPSRIFSGTLGEYISWGSSLSQSWMNFLEESEETLFPKKIMEE